MIARAALVFPEPDSPTSASVSPRAMVRLRPDRRDVPGARTTPPQGTAAGYVTCRSRTSNSGDPARAAGAAAGATAAVTVGPHADSAPTRAVARPQAPRSGGTRPSAPAPTDRRAGRSSRHTSRAAGQRGANGQPAGSTSGRAAAPRICGSRRRRSRCDGMDAPRPAVYGWRGRKRGRDATGLRRPGPRTGRSRARTARGRRQGRG